MHVSMFYLLILFESIWFKTKAVKIVYQPNTCTFFILPKTVILSILSSYMYLFWFTGLS